MALDNYLREQAIRLLRTKWPAPYQLAEELFHILKGIDVDTTGPITVTLPGFDPITIPPFPDFTTNPIEFLDLDLPTFEPEIPTVVITDFDPFDWIPPDWPEWPPQGEDTNPSYSTREEKRKFWHRAIFPAEILEDLEGDNYRLKLWPNGELNTSDENPFTPSFVPDSAGVGPGDEPTQPPTAEPTTGAPVAGEQEPAQLDVTARLADTNADAEEGQWVYCYWVARYEETKTFYLVNGAIKKVETEFELLQDEYLFIPGGGGGGARIAVVTEKISGREGLTPGTGKADLYELVDGQLAPMKTENPDPSGDEEEDNVEVTVYSMVSGEIEPAEEDSDSEDKLVFIQVKKISGEWWVDVEDCGGPKEAAVVE